VWKNQFGKQHGLLLIKRFWENVEPKNYRSKLKLVDADKKKDNIVIMFEPDDGEWMLVPTIFDIWKRKDKPTLYSTALITDEPLEEIAQAGHNRTPISLTPEAAEQWLDTPNRSPDEFLALLDDIKRPYYEHAVAA
jgi:putative SOS response-associated peptidase YedK